MPVYFPTTSNALYGTGPVSFQPGELAEAVKRSAYPGVDYHLTLKMGRRRGGYAQRGWLIASTLASLNAIRVNAQDCVGSTGTLKDVYGNVYSSVTLVDFAPDPVIHRRSDQYAQRYAAVYDQSGQ
jgi:hypothetical protein